MKKFPYEKACVQDEKALVQHRARDGEDGEQRISIKNKENLHSPANAR